jgi:hypothetical protein
MRANSPVAPLYLAALAFLVAAVLAYSHRRPGDEAQLATAALALVCVGGAVSSLLRRRLVAGLCAIIAGIGVWAASGAVDYWLRERGRFLVAGPLLLALLALVMSQPRQDQ